MMALLSQVQCSFGFILILLLLSGGVYTSNTEGEEQEDGSNDETCTLVNTDCGPVEGVIETSTEGKPALVYKGIPYAKPPINKRRWKPPQPLDKKYNGQCWKGTLEAKKPGSPCAQMHPRRAKSLIGSEDCLFLNVWAPKRKNRRLLPVVVYIHGGGLIYNHGAKVGYSPNADFANALDVVAVSLNYRLNVFGFLTLDVLNKYSKKKSSANYGFMDAIEALRWIKRNIKAFGGDPNLVTIFGQSGGGKVVYALLASPLADGLFHRAITVSAAAVYTKSLKVQAKENAVYIKRARCNKKTDRATYNCLYKLSTIHAIAAVPWYVYPYWAAIRTYDIPRKGELYANLAVVDRVVVPVSPLNLKPRCRKEVPVMIISNSEESEHEKMRQLNNLPAKVFKGAVARHLNTFSKRITKKALKYYYPKMSKKPQYGLSYIRLASDLRFNCPNSVAAQRFALNKRRQVYRMVITTRPGKPIKERRGQPHYYAYHGWETTAIFNFQEPGAGDYGPKKLYKPTAGDKAYRDKLQGLVAYFARHGHPGERGWKPYPKTTAILRGSRVVVQRLPYHAKECRFWNKNGFFIYGTAL